MSRVVTLDARTCTRAELEAAGRELAELDDRDQHACGDRERCRPFAGVRCGAVGRELHLLREVWRDRNRREWKHVHYVNDAGACACGFKPPTRQVRGSRT